MCVLPPDGAQQRGSGLVVEGDDDGGWRKIRVIMKSGAPTRERESMIKHDIRSTRWKHMSHALITLKDNDWKRLQLKEAAGGYQTCCFHCKQSTR